MRSTQCWIQGEFKRELKSLGEQDPNVDEEIALLTEACPATAMQSPTRGLYLSLVAMLPSSGT